MHHFSISHWEREASRLRRVVKRRHRTEQLLFTGWFTYTNSELSALKDHHRRRKQSIITVVFCFLTWKGWRVSVAGLLWHSASIIRVLSAFWEQCGLNGNHVFFYRLLPVISAPKPYCLHWADPLPCFLHPPHTHFISVLFEVTFLNKMNFTVRRVRTSMRVSC